MSAQFSPVPLNRRGFLTLAAGAAAAGLAACSTGTRPAGSPVLPDSGEVRAAEAARRAANAPVREVALRSEPATVDLGGVQVRTWTYGGRLPGQEIRLTRGEVLRAQITNALPAPTTVHWHGVALRNDMDGSPGITQPQIEANGSFRYEFTVPDPGTHWFHPHVGLQLDRGLYAPLIVEDPADGRDYDIEAVIVLDDWLDGVAGRTPDRQLQQLQTTGTSGMNMGGMNMGGMSMPTDPDAPLGSDAGDVKDYPYFLINGRIGTDPVTLTGKPGQRMRLRIVNAAADTAFRVAVGGHRLRVTHTDGYPVVPVTAAGLLIGMGERYDAIIDLADGVFPLVAAAEGKTGQGFALIRTGTGTAPAAGTRPTELTAAPLTADKLTAVDSASLPRKNPDRTLDVALGADSRRYLWTINGRTYDQRTPLEVAAGERVRLRFTNQTMMFHPMHLHGHTFQLRTPAGTGPRKDTVVVASMQTVEADLDTTNPGQWMLHCHNAYHQEAGMMTVMSYVR
ncbi:multicopper oxidase family protein [Nocardia arizonensis]|uniref:multicopper oxidase family protein n=1 Tax=Nocardia arizonensis TaxID=1141647 RepID=UPI0006D20963|nr:multicopper oxidase family protein [Nocardia arizonensis]